MNIPLKIEELLDRGCWSFHLDQSSDVSEEQISKLVAVRFETVNIRNGKEMEFEKS